MALTTNGTELVRMQLVWALSDSSERTTSGSGVGTSIVGGLQGEA